MDVVVDRFSAVCLGVCESETEKVKPDWCESVGDRKTEKRKKRNLCVCLFV